LEALEVLGVLEFLVFFGFGQWKKVNSRIEHGTPFHPLPKRRLSVRGSA